MILSGLRMITGGNEWISLNVQWLTRVRHCGPTRPAFFRRAPDTDMSDNAISVQPSSQRKRELLEYWERDNGKQDRPIWLNAAFRENDRKFMRFLIPSGKRVLELGCGSGDLLSALEPSHGVGVDFCASAVIRAKARHPELDFVLGDAEDPTTL